MSSLPSHFVPDQPGRLTKRSFQSPYSYRASGLAQIAVSALLRANSIGARDILAAEHCRYGTRDLSLIFLHRNTCCLVLDGDLLQIAKTIQTFFDATRRSHPR